MADGLEPFLRTELKRKWQLLKLKDIETGTYRGFQLYKQDQLAMFGHSVVTSFDSSKLE